jgi:hypothetical protein
VGEVVCRGRAVVQPLEEVAERKKALVEGAHDFGVGEGRPARHLAVCCQCLLLLSGGWWHTLVPAVTHPPRA